MLAWFGVRTAQVRKWPVVYMYAGVWCGWGRRIQSTAACQCSMMKYIYIHLLYHVQNMRPHYHDSTISRPICEVKHGQVWLVLAVGDQLGSPDAAYFFRVFSTAGSNPTVLIAVKKFQQIKYMILLCTTASLSWFGVQFCLLLAHCDAAPSSAGFDYRVRP